MENYVLVKEDTLRRIAEGVYLRPLEAIQSWKESGAITPLSQGQDTFTYSNGYLSLTVHKAKTPYGLVYRGYLTLPDGREMGVSHTISYPELEASIFLMDDDFVVNKILAANLVKTIMAGLHVKMEKELGPN